MRKAYDAAFPKLAVIKDIFSDRNLARLEAMRHVIVHRGGIVDREFLAKTGGTIAVGTPLPIDESAGVLYFNAVTENGCALLTGLDTHLKHFDAKAS